MYAPPSTFTFCWEHIPHKCTFLPLNSATNFFFQGGVCVYLGRGGGRPTERAGTGEVGKRRNKASLREWLHHPINAKTEWLSKRTNQDQGTLAWVGLSRLQLDFRILMSLSTEMHFECDISPFRIQTSTQSHPCIRRWTRYIRKRKGTLVHHPWSN